MPSVTPERYTCTRPKAHVRGGELNDKKSRRRAGTNVGIGTGLPPDFASRSAPSSLPAGHFTTTVVRIQGWMQH
jgi:hypothetical protein